MRSLPGLLVGPTLLLALIPGMAVKACLGIICALGNEDELVCYMVPCLSLILPGEESVDIFRAERLCHEQSVEPHLMRIDLLMPISTLACARMGCKLLPQSVSGCEITLFTCAVVSL